MNIIGQGQTGTIIDAEKKNRIFLIISGVRVTIGNLTLNNGTTSANGGAILNNGNLTLLPLLKVTVPITPSSQITMVV